MKIVYSFTLSGLFLALFSHAIQAKDAKSEPRYAPQEKDSPAYTRENTTRNKLCPECSRIYPGDINFCSVDGKQLTDYREEELACPTCKESAAPGEKFCKNDGTQLVPKRLVDKKAFPPDTKVEIKLSPDAPPEERMKAVMYHLLEGNRLCEELNDFTSALEEYKKAEALNSALPAVHFRIGGVYWKLGKAKESLFHLDKCKQLMEAQPPEIKESENYLKSLEDVKVYISKLEKGLDQTEKQQRLEVALAARGEKMKQALAENREKWAATILIPAGKFIMGTAADERIPEETPQREVYVDAYYMDKFEVTNAQYWEFLEYIKKTGDHSKCYAGEPREKNHAPGTPHTNWDYPYYDFPDYPVTRLDWYDAYAYAAWAGKRLPTEAEWEKAARGTDGRRFPWGNVWDAKRCNVGANAPLSVGSFEYGKSLFGCMDMVGSVSEWCNDWYHPEYFQTAPSVNPKGPEANTGLRVVKGGSLFAPNAQQMRCAVRIFAKPEDRNKSIGFRCAKDVKPETETPAKETAKPEEKGK